MSMPSATSQGDSGGREVAAARKARGLTQQELARKAAVSLSLIRKVEQGKRPVTPAVRDALAAAIGPAAPVRCAPVPGNVTQVLARLREAMDAYDLPPDPRSEPVPLPELSRITGTATSLRLASGYTQLAALLPRLLRDLTATALTSAGRDRDEAFGLLALAYRAADAIADKHGCHDLSARATELIRWAAERSTDPLLETMSAYVRAELFFAGQHARNGLRLIDSVAGSAPPPGDVPRLAMHGALCMRAAVLAAHAAMPAEAADRIAEARAVARHVPDGVYHGTAFGPSSVRVHELALAVEAGDASRAISLAGQWQPPDYLPAERRSHFYIEAARAYGWTGHRDQALSALWQARRAAPQHTRCNRAVAETVSLLIRTSRKPPPPLLQFAAWISQPSPG